MDRVEAVGNQVDLNSNRLTRLETSADVNRWMIEAILVPVMIMLAKTIADIVLTRKRNGATVDYDSPIAKRLANIETNLTDLHDRMQKWQG